MLPRKLLLLVSLIISACSNTYAQNGLQPQQTAASPLQIRISDGTILDTLGNWKFLATNVTLTANATNYIYFSLSTSPPTLTINTTGFPSSQYYPLATVVTSGSQIISMTDSRPGFNTNLAGGGVTTPSLSYSNITTNANTQVLSGSGMLGAIQINNPGSGWSAQIFDNTSCSGTTIATTSSLSSLSGNTLNYYVTFNTGLCVKTTGTTPGDLTVTYSNTAGTFSYSNITASTNTQIKSGSGTLQWIQINNPGSGWSATIYDNTSCSGTKIATITSFSGLTVAFLKYTLKFNTGCCIATTGATPGDLTIARI